MSLDALLIGEAWQRIDLTIVTIPQMLHIQHLQVKVKSIVTKYKQRNLKHYHAQGQL